jgi:hypothetical protein
MIDHRWITFLHRLSSLFHFHHYIEFIIIILLAIWYFLLKQYRVKRYLLLLVIILPLDVFITFSSLYQRVRLLQLIQFEGLIFAALIYSCLKSKKISILFWILIIDLLETLIAYEYSIRGWNNLFLDNLDCIITAPLFFILFYRMFNFSLRIKYSQFYFLIALASICFFVYDYVIHDNLKFNYLAIIIFNLQHFIICCLIIANIIRNENSGLTNDPYFWVCCGRIIASILNIIWTGLHPYLVEHFIEIYKSPFLRNLMPASHLVSLFCYLYAFFLCGIHCRNKLTLALSTFFQNKAPGY